MVRTSGEFGRTEGFCYPSRLVSLLELNDLDQVAHCVIKHRDDGRTNISWFHGELNAGSLELTVKRADGSTVTLPVEEDLEDLADSK